jgi:hypothetical protein
VVGCGGSSSSSTISLLSTGGKSPTLSEPQMSHVEAESVLRLGVGMQPGVVQ